MMKYRNGKFSLQLPLGLVFLAASFLGLILAFNLLFGRYFPNKYNAIGHDYVLGLNNLVDGYIWLKNNGLFAVPWFTPSFCGGQAFFADPQSMYYSFPQLLTVLFQPLTSIYITFVVFAVMGFWGMYFFCRFHLRLCALPSIFAACAFMFNGFFVHRMIVGHFGFHSFMLVPAMGYLTIAYRREKMGSVQIGRGFALGFLIAYSFHSGLTTLIPPAALAVVSLFCLVAIFDKEVTVCFKKSLMQSSFALVIAIGLSASKLVAGLELMSHFKRDYYLLPGIDSISGIARFIFTSFFFSSQRAYEVVTPLWRNMQISAMPHELSFGLTPVVLVVVVLGLGFSILKMTKIRHVFEIRSTATVALGVLVLILIVPFGLLYYSPGWNLFLKSIPLIGSTTSPFRWLIIYIPLICALGGVAANSISMRYRALVCVVAIVGVPFFNFLEDMDFYQAQFENPWPAINFYNQIKSGAVRPLIRSVEDPRLSDGAPTIDNNAFIFGKSAMRCYNPVYGYALENLVVSPLEEGRVDKITKAGTYNIHNPACLVFPRENHCALWDAFPLDRKDSLDRFVSYKPFDFRVSFVQKVATWITLFTLFVSFAYIIYAVIGGFRRRWR